MKMNLEQTKLVGLTMELDLKAREYKMLCKKLEEMKQSNLSLDSKEWKDLLKDFVKNQDEIVRINNELNELKNKPNE